MLVIPQKKRYEGVAGRIVHIGAAIVLAFALLGARLWYLQMVNWRDAKGLDAADLAAKYRLRLQTLKAPRGMIYGRDPNVVLADNQASCDLMLVPGECDDPEAVCQRLAELVGINPKELLKQIEQSKKPQPFAQILVKRDLSKIEVTRVEESSFALPGVFTMFRPQRRYLYGKTAGQVLGYVGEIGLEELKRKADLYDMGDLIGKGGLEARYEDRLRGTSGRILVIRYASGEPQLRTDEYGKPYIEVDSHGRRLEEAENKGRDPVAGGTLHTTLDIGLQARAEQILEGKAGAICVLNADTGEVLALASSPGYDPSVFVNRGRTRERLELLQDTEFHPMLNRCFQAEYPPGSVFKIILASAALEEGVITEHTTFNCPGRYTLAGRSWKCWRHSGHGRVNVVDAMVVSCDVFFYNVGLKLGVEKINQYTELFGQGKKTGVDLPGEVPGLAPSPAWKKEFVGRTDSNPYNQRWYPGDTLNLSIGQGAMSATPLQCAAMMAVVVNGGRLVRPYLNQELGPQVSEPFLSEKTLEIVRRSMQRCVEKEDFPSGTGRLAKIKGLAVLGKTGTAQVVSEEHYEKLKEEDIPYKRRNHAWFVAGVLGQPVRLAVCVLVEHGLHGSSGAAPLAKEILANYYGPGGSGIQPLQVAATEENE